MTTILSPLPSRPAGLTARKALILRIVNVFETGKPEGDYSAVSIYPDGPDGRRQITYGRSQTTEYSHLPALLRSYILHDGHYSHEISRMLPLLRTDALINDHDFLEILQLAGTDPIMRQCQDELFDEAYWKPSQTWAEAQKFTLPLSALVIYDSFIHSGRVPDFLRASFVEKPPEQGGDEKNWIEEYTQARHRWLTFHRREILQASAYRTRFLLDQIDHANWQLDQLPLTVNKVAVS